MKPGIRKRIHLSPGSESIEARASRKYKSLKGSASQSGLSLNSSTTASRAKKVRHLEEASLDSEKGSQHYPPFNSSLGEAKTYVTKHKARSGKIKKSKTKMKVKGQQSMKSYIPNYRTNPDKPPALGEGQKQMLIKTTQSKFQPQTFGRASYGTKPNKPTGGSRSKLGGNTSTSGVIRLDLSKVSPGNSSGKKKANITHKVISEGNSPVRRRARDR